MESTIDKPKTADVKPGAKPESKDDLKSLPMAEVEKKLSSSPDGLTQAEADKRLTQYGPNEIEEKKTNLLLKFLSYFWGPIPWMIEAAVILSGVVGHWPDFFIILVLLVSNAGVGLPTLGMTTVSGTQYLTLTYRQNPLMTGITVNMQTSPDLQTWTTLKPSDVPRDFLSEQVGTDSTTGDPIMEVGVTANGLTKQFIRLNVTGT